MLANNSTLGRGAAIFATAPITILNSTIVDGTGNPKQAILTWSSATIRNTILSGFEAALISAGVNTLVNEDYNVFSNNGVDTQELGGGQFVNGGHSHTYEELRFVDAANHNYQLKFTSPAVDKGIATNLSVDAAGQPRPYAGGLVDVGAYEFQGAGGPALAIYRQNPIAAAPDLPFAYRFPGFESGR